jgi:hypothetical protein
MRNDYLDRALIVSALGLPDAVFFQAVPMIDHLLRTGSGRPIGPD